MNTKKIWMYIGLGALVYYLLKRNSMQGDKQPGMMKKFTNKVKDSVKKDLDEVADDIPSRPVMSSSLS